MNTLALSPTWDLMVDDSKNIAMNSGPQAVVQDVASVVSTFLGEVYYDTGVGLPYLSEVMTKPYAPTLLTPMLANAAKLVPSVVAAKTVITGFNMTTRKISGNLNIIDTSGQALGVTF